MFTVIIKDDEFKQKFELLWLCRSCDIGSGCMC